MVTGQLPAYQLCDKLIAVVSLLEQYFSSRTSGAAQESTQNNTTGRKPDKLIWLVTCPGIVALLLM